MANTDSPNGFTPAYHLTGGTIRQTEMRIADDYNTAIFSGDLVKRVAAGTIEVCAAGDVPTGVFMGCSFTKDDGEVVFSKHWPASQSVSGSYATAFVMDDPNVVLRAQFDGASGIADLGQLADMVATHSGSTVNGRSGQEVSSTTGTSTATFRILEFVDSPSNDPASDNAEVLVTFAEHAYMPSAVAAGV